MHYAPHTMWLLPKVEFTKDEFGRPVPAGRTEPFEIGECRCDETVAVEFSDENGKVVKPDWHIVCSMSPAVGGLKPNDTVMVTADNETLCEGNILRIKRLNYLPYAEIWM